MIPPYISCNTVGQRKLNLNETTTDHAEEHIFGPSAGKVRTAVKRANEILLKKLVDPKTGNITHVDWLFDQVLDPEAMNISNYWYLPGGHWKPTNCLPRWKVNIASNFLSDWCRLKKTDEKFVDLKTSPLHYEICFY